MKIYTWLHSTAFSSWSVMEELKIHKDNYTNAEVMVLAESEEEALKLLEKNGHWNIEDLRQIRPVVTSLEEVSILRSFIS